MCIAGDVVRKGVGVVAVKETHGKHRGQDIQNLKEEEERKKNGCEVVSE